MTTTAEPASPPRQWQRASGVELLGLVNGSGLNHSTYLVRRADGQVVQLTELLHHIVAEAAPALPSDELARRVSARFGRELDVEGLTLLAESKLEPLGLLQSPGAAPAAPPPSANPLLALSAKATLLSRGAVSRLASLLSPLYAPPVVVLACLALVVLDVRLFWGSDVLGALSAVLVTPTMLFSLYALMIVGALVHEVGHAAACRYGGAKPGVIGMGLYLVFPAFFTDVTDAYRLGRAGKIRTDLGGLYFHVWWVLSAGAAYLLTDSPLLLMLVIMTQLQMAQQLPPTIRLDGYFVLADLAGVPDLFARVGPVLRSLIPGRAADPRVKELRPASRWIVTAWVLIVVPFLAGVVVWLVLSLPIILTEAAGAVMTHASGMALALALGQPIETVLSLLAILLLALPALGSLLILGRLAQSLERGLRKRFFAPPIVRNVPRHAAPPRRFRLVGYRF
jgi:putative peptide zinc metalloprotease protein